ncbi:hypothetical protein BKA61DRAFT_617386 [Leptodontidium sp. MPI-SDFR-AT-0119]|nr:hypothetical protein BKA61DRAFT_617386 [Leptodontidium sp. MPI-SDFR-AT-0119]
MLGDRRTSPMLRQAFNSWMRIAYAVPVLTLETGLANHTPRTAQSSIRPRKETVDMETHVVRVGERRQGTRWMLVLVPPMPWIKV